MKKYLFAAAILALAGIVASISACGSSVAQQDSITQADVDAAVAKAIEPLTDRLDLMAGEIAALQAAMGPRTARGSASTKADGDAFIGQFSPVFFTGANCTGDGFVSSGHVSANAGRQGFVFILREPGSIDVDTSPYYMIAPGTQRESFSAVSRHDGQTGCVNTTLDIDGYAAVLNDVEVCGVPDHGVPDPVWPSGAPTEGTMFNAREVEVYTDKDCLTFVPDTTIPKIIVGEDPPVE